MKSAGKVGGFYIHAQKTARGPVMLFNGKSFTNRPDDRPFAYTSQFAGEYAAKKLLGRFPILSHYKIWVSQVFFADPEKSVRINPAKKVSKAQRALTLAKAEEVCRLQGWPKSMARKLLALDKKQRKERKENPSAPERAEKMAEQLDAAAQKLEDFSGHKATHVTRAKPRSNERAGLVIGELDLIGYRAKRDGKTERYAHTFRKNSRPLLAVSSDGKQLHVVGGQYEFTEAGIEDR